MNKQDALDALKVDPTVAVWDAIARLKDSLDRLADKVERMSLRETVDQDARDDIAVLQSDLTALTTRVTTAESDIDALQTWRTDDEPKIDALYPTHDNLRHDPDYSAVGHTHTYSDITGQHTSSAHDTSVPTETEVANMRSVYNGHNHQFNEQDTVFTPDPPFTGSNDTQGLSRNTATPSSTM
jgi:hypothetical protein